MLKLSDISTSWIYKYRYKIIALEIFLGLMIIVSAFLIIFPRTPRSPEISRRVSIKNEATRLIPAKLTISKGESIEWTNGDIKDHEIIFENEKLKITAKSRVSKEFENEGEFEYMIDYSDLKGKVIVK